MAAYWVQTRARSALALELQGSLSVTLWAGDAPESAPGPDRPAGAGQGAEPVVDPTLAHAGRIDESGNRHASLGSQAQGHPQQRVGAVGLFLVPRVIWAGVVRGGLVAAV